MTLATPTHYSELMSDAGICTHADDHSQLLLTIRGLDGKLASNANTYGSPSLCA